MAFLQTAIQTAHHFQASYKPNTAVTDWIERLCSSSYKVTEYEGIPELVDSINLQSTGPSEAARMLRKKLKYGNTHMQLRAIFIIKCLVENCGERTNFAKNFPDPTFVERMKILAGDPQTDPTVKKHLMSTLKGFHAQYKDDRSMRVYAQWWDEVGGARGEEDERARQAYLKERERLDKEQQLRLDEKMAARLQSEEDEHAAKLREKRRKMKELQEADARAKEAAEKLRGEERARAEAREEERREYERKKAEKKKNSFWSMGDSSSSTSATQKTGTAAKRAPFNFEAEKPKISQAVATASMYANGLVNALQRVNREQESVASNTQVQDQLFKLKETRKLIVRYIHLCEVDKEGEYIGMLISSNDQIIAALRLYDRMLTKPADEDSDDDEAVQQSRAAAQNTTAADAAAATSGQPARDQEEADRMAASLAKVRLNNNSIQSFGELDKLRDRQRTEIYRNNQARAAQGLPTPGIYSDLQGINFGQNLPQPMDPKHAVETRDTYEQGSLSEYSDYTSSDEEDDHRYPSSSTGNRAWKDFVQEEEANRGSLLDDDPFGDSAGVETPGAYDRPRAHVWAEI